MTYGTDEGALQSCGDGVAFRTLYDEHVTRGIRFVDSLLRDPGEAEELVQEAFFRLLPTLKRSATVDHSGFAALFFRTLRNLTIDVLRARRRRGALSLDEIPEPATAPAGGGPDDRLERRLRRLMDELPRPLAEALELRVNGRLSYDEIAEVLGASHAQVRTWIYRARRRLETALAQSEEPEADRHEAL